MTTWGHAPVSGCHTRTGAPVELRGATARAASCRVDIPQAIRVCLTARRVSVNVGAFAGAVAIRSGNTVGGAPICGAGVRVRDFTPLNAGTLHREPHTLSIGRAANSVAILGATSWYTGAVLGGAEGVGEAGCGVEKITWFNASRATVVYSHHLTHWIRSTRWDIT